MLTVKISQCNLINSFVSLVVWCQLGEKAASLNVAELYVGAFSNLAKTNNTVVLPANVGDAASMVAQVSWARKSGAPGIIFTHQVSFSATNQN